MIGPDLEAAVARAQRGDAAAVEVVLAAVEDNPTVGAVVLVRLVRASGGGRVICYQLRMG